jgi:hypothetical protein
VRKTLAIALAFGILTQCSVSAAVVAPSKPTPPAPAPLKASDVRIPISGTGKTVSLQELSIMNVDDPGHLTGKKMGWFKRMAFKLARLRAGYYDDDSSFHIGGFALGFLLALVGVLFAYLIHDAHHHQRVKWAWIGCGCCAVLGLLLLFM